MRHIMKNTFKSGSLDVIGSIESRDVDTTRTGKGIESRTIRGYVNSLSSIRVERVSRPSPAMESHQSGSRRYGRELQAEIGLMVARCHRAPRRHRPDAQTVAQVKQHPLGLTGTSRAVYDLQCSRWGWRRKTRSSTPLDRVAGS